MTIGISLLLVVIAVICFILAGVGFQKGKIEWIAWGLAAWSLSQLVSGFIKA